MLNIKNFGKKITAFLQRGFRIRYMNIFSEIIATFSSFSFVCSGKKNKLTCHYATTLAVLFAIIILP